LTIRSDLSAKEEEDPSEKKDPSKEEGPIEDEETHIIMINSDEEDSKEERNKQEERENFQQLVQILFKLKVEMTMKEMLEQNPCCMKLLPSLARMKEQPKRNVYLHSPSIWIAFQCLKKFL